MTASVSGQEGSTADDLIETIGGLTATCRFFGWQGGTLQQARDETKKRLAAVGVFPDRNGVFGTLVIGG